MANIVVVSLDADAYYAASVVDLLRDCGSYTVLGVTSVQVLSGAIAWADMLVFWDTPISLLSFAMEARSSIPILVLVPGIISDFEEKFPQTNVHFESNALCAGRDFLDRVQEPLSA
ncbi:MAG: hypothetical protein ABIJ36_03845 [Patescibacteria group bacterium]